MITDRRAFILENTRFQPTPHAPELSLHLADEITPIWRLTEEDLATIGLPPPFWAFAWAGGQALARFILDHPDIVAGKRVVDFASGSGIVAIAAMKAGAASALAADIDVFCEAAIAVNAEAHG
ncbi:MAG TPA: 50S ribosomal protein L11 methyltransferase, partial [Caulobacter sp.]|nr:50S ribosomal protein L11 methyltransferase [Caulobacter sp.]